MATIESLMGRTAKVGDCLEFIGHIGRSGYGLMWHDGKTRQAHRVSFELHNTPIMDGQHVMHACDNRKCINPAHLKLGTRQENMADMVAKRRGNHTRGVSHPLAKMTPEIAAEIRKRYRPYDHKNGSMALAREFGLSQPAVHTCIRGETWKT